MGVNYFSQLLSCTELNFTQDAHNSVDVKPDAQIIVCVCWTWSTVTKKKRVTFLIGSI